LAVCTPGILQFLAFLQFSLIPFNSDSNYRYIWKCSFFAVYDGDTAAIEVKFFLK